MAVDRRLDRRLLPAAFVTALCTLVLVTVAGNVPLAVAAPGSCGLPGVDGPRPALGGIVNTYFAGASASVTAGDTSLTLAASIGAATPIAAGDKVLIIQMQSADIDATNSDAYGDGTAGEPPSGASDWGAAGFYELAVAANSVSAVGGTLQLTAGTANAYVSSAATGSKGQQTFQVVRVPQYSSATLGANVTATPWNGAAGGIVALDVAGALDLNGFRIDASSKGFRGGAGRQLGGGGGANTDIVTSASNTYDGSKAEGVAGTPRFVFDGTSTTDTGVEGYPNGSFARGAPANAGGGGTDGHPAGNDENTGGGGGGNGGAGGRGGNSWSSNLPVGGAGGAALPTPGPARLALGGGGGGATRNNAGPSSGGVGGGIVILDIGSFAGSGEIRANGDSGQTAANDGGGGGGAGGSVVVAATGGTLSGLTVNANGGIGGDAWPTQAPGVFPGARHGPGGGGGGGVVLVSTAGAATSANGAAHGITTTANDAYNSTDGSAGTVGSFAGTLPGAGNAASCAPQLAVTKTTSTPNVTNTAAGTTATYTIVVANTAGRNDAENVKVTDVLPTGVTLAATGAIVLGGGATRPAVSNPLAGAGSPSWGEFTIPGGGSVSVGFTVDIAGSVAAGALQNPAGATYPDPARTTASGTTTASYDPASSTGEDVNVGWPDLTVAKSHGGEFSRGASHAYAVTATNSGNAASTGTVTLTDVVPAGLTPTGAAGTGWACGIVSQTVTCSRSDALAAGAGYPAVAITVSVAQSAASSVTNTATVAGGGEQAIGNNSASDPTTIVDSADLAMTKTSSPNPYTAGSTITYTVGVRNNGTSNVTGAVVDDTIPAAVSGVTWTCAITSGSGACGSASGSGNVIGTTVDLTSGGAVATFTIVGTVGAGTTGALANSATVTAPSGVIDPIPANNSATDTNPTVPMADLETTKTSTPDPYVAGSGITYTVTVTNNGPDAVSGAPFADSVPSQVTGVTWTCAITGSGACGSASGSGNAISTTLDLANGAIATFVIDGTVAPGTTGPVSNTASASPPSGTVDPSPGNNSATDDNPTGSVQADPQIAVSPVTHSGAPGTGATFVVDVRNNGPDAAQNVQAVLTLPSAFAIGSAAGGGWSCSVVVSVITCDLAGALAPGTPASPITLQTTLPSSAGPYSLTATVASATPDTNSANNSATAAVTVSTPTVSTPQPPAAPPAEPPSATDNAGVAGASVVTQVDLMATKTASARTFVVGKPASFTIVVRNLGPDDVTGAVIRDVLPAALGGFTWVCTAVLAQCTDTTGSGSIAQTVDIGAGGRLSYRLSGRVTRATPTSIVNHVTVSAPPGVVDSNPANNAAEARVRVVVGPTHLRVTVLPGVAKVRSGETARFVVTTSNLGAGPARGVVTCLTIPSGAKVALAHGGRLAKRRYCWRALSLAAAARVRYAITIRGEGPRAASLVLAATAVARNASAVHARARLIVTAPPKQAASGPFTG